MPKRLKIAAAVAVLAVVGIAGGIGITNSGPQGPSLGGTATCAVHINGGYSSAAGSTPLPGASGPVFGYKAAVNRVGCKTIPTTTVPTGTVSLYDLSPSVVQNVTLTRLSTTVTAPGTGVFAGVTIGEAVLGNNIVGSTVNPLTVTTVTGINASSGGTSSITISQAPNQLTASAPTIVEGLTFQPYFLSQTTGQVVPSQIVVAGVSLNGTTAASVTPTYPVTTAQYTDNFNLLESYSSNWGSIQVTGTNIPPNTELSAVASGGGSLTLSNAATGTGTSTLTFTLPAMCSGTLSDNGGGNALGTCTASSSNPDLNPNTESDAANVWDYYPGDSTFLPEVDPNFDTTTNVQTYVYPGTNAYNPAANVCGTTAPYTTNCGYNTSLSAPQNIANNYILTGPLPINSPVTLVAAVRSNDNSPWGDPQGEVDFQLKVPGTITIGAKGSGSNTLVALSPNFCVATFIGNDYQKGISLFGCTLTPSSFSATGPTSGCPTSGNPTVDTTCVGTVATSSILTMAPSPINPYDSRGYPYHGVFNYAKIVAPFCGLGCVLTGGATNYSPWQSANTGATQGIVPPSVPSNCTTDITAELLAGTGGHWSGSVWNGAGGCYSLPNGLELDNSSNITIENATIYDSQVQSANLPTGVSQGWNPIIFIKGGGTGGTSGGWSPGCNCSPAWTYTGSNNDTLSNLSLIGTDETGGYIATNVTGAGVYVNASYGENLDNITTANTWGDGLETFGAPPMTNLNVCNDGTSPCAYTVTNAGRDSVTINCVQGNGTVSGTVNGVTKVFGPSTFNGLVLHGGSGQGNAFDLESDLTNIGLQFPTQLYINNSQWDGLFYNTTYNQGNITFNNDTEISGWLHMTAIIPGNQPEYGGKYTFYGGTFNSSYSPMMDAVNQATVAFYGSTFVDVNGPNRGWSASSYSSITFHTEKGKYPPPDVAGIHDSTSTVSIVP